MTSTLDRDSKPVGVSDERFDVRRFMSPLAGGLPGAANVIMQLSWPAVGYGVLESRVDSGSAMKHPIKRGRTTFTYLAVALLGDDEDRRRFRSAVNGQHAQVYSTEESPVAYRAMDPKLQLWVAACLYYGLVDLTERLHGPLDDATADRLFSYSARLGTTLQVRPHMWPADRGAFRSYWEESLAQVHIDAVMREYLLGLVELKNLPRPFQLLFAGNNLFWTKGFLPPLFREEMGFTWSGSDEEKFTRTLRRIGRLERPIPPALKALPFSLLLADMRRRVRAGRPLV
ncbi:MAG TPA: oxygenase MpaB family protein [Acidimicrobiales bacterium]|nr:oxygenase MpaB family protein [Acidimicrobiales bacterium]